MKWISFLIITALVLMISCNGGPEKNIQNQGKIIPRDKMVNLMAEMQIVEAHIDELRKAGHKTKDSTLYYYEKVFVSNEVLPADFENSLLYYKQNLDELQLIYADVITRLSELKAKNEELISSQKSDSLSQDTAKTMVEVKKVNPKK